jgi:hypothetical protein
LLKTPLLMFQSTTNDFFQLISITFSLLSIHSSLLLLYPFLQIMEAALNRRRINFLSEAFESQKNCLLGEKTLENPQLISQFKSYKNVILNLLTILKRSENPICFLQNHKDKLQAKFPMKLIQNHVKEGVLHHCEGIF